MATTKNKRATSTPKATDPRTAGKTGSAAKPDSNTSIQSTKDAELMPDTVSAEAPAKDEASKPKPVGIRVARTKAFLAGVIIKRHGLAAGVTEKMVAELGELYGGNNDADQTRANLQWAWHAARGAISGDTE